MGYIVCEECGGHYQLQEGESPDDFESCQCGGQLKYVETLEGNDIDYETAKTDDRHACPNCGSPISEYSIICRNCGYTIEMDDMLSKKIESEKPDCADVINTPAGKGIDGDDIGKTLEESPDDITPSEYDDSKLIKDGEGVKNNDLKRVPVLEEDISLENVSDAASPHLEKQTMENMETVFRDSKSENICPKCKKENDPDSNFCKFCGFELHDLVNKKFSNQKNKEKSHSDRKTCPSCGADIHIESIICRNCGKTLQNDVSAPKSDFQKAETKSIVDEELTPDLIVNDFVYILSSLDFYKPLILLGFAVVFAGKIVGLFVTDLIFMFCAIIFAVLSKKNTRISLEGSFLMAIFGIIVILIIQTSWNISPLDLFIFLFFSLMGGFVGRQLIKRNLVK
ncbi:zinc ribbon domain-containing protein [Methanobacterium alcaliphilum]|uniref:zinc ribbon domain-containing protein n=1 Tax=Methanobacterium alcaliphilum TaxID=392018 RepID=UPI00200A3A13|nr:zinc ribbon domain-containing protein [Methanobacterium alcaliphilum]MCK9152606.1 zinc ribbon domain-containing protein [Methanobacterium alcaliphilum]